MATNGEPTLFLGDGE